MGERIRVSHDERVLTGPLLSAERGRGCHRAGDKRRYSKGMVRTAGRVAEVLLQMLVTSGQGYRSTIREMILAICARWTRLAAIAAWIGHVAWQERTSTSHRH